MLSVILKDNHEPNVIKLTYENIWKELKDIPNSELLVRDHWGTNGIKNRYVCFLEADCLVNSAYFETQLGLLKKDPMYRKVAMMSSGIGVNNWANKFYGYSIGDNYTDGVIPMKEKKSSRVYPVQIGYVPGSIIHVGMLQKLDIGINDSWEDDLVYMSTMISLAFWKQGVGNGVGNRVHINPNTTYVTTEDYVNDIGKFDPEAGGLITMFKNQAIS